ncbi:hypothetical protein CAEBREN_28643 [Caenorhabditis brenneri]|uniref:Uncharacterized protein n=1 Tax=Caenorhabditis brenneri TaxID=135651 RepID=G0MV68_CAEBE|nr:hypothetical protein CAEBREN_28643 [Caenorhabditis brenneri]
MCHRNSSKKSWNRTSN